MKQAISWFELPVADLARARRFYEAVLGAALREEVFGGLENAIFPHEQKKGVGGALVKSPHLRPSGDGALVYLAAAGLDGCLGRVERAGGKVLMPRTDIGPPGFIAVIEDTEGNRVGLHEARAA